MAERNRASCDVWLWDGISEYEGLLITFDEGVFCARVRPVARGGHSLGRSIPASPLDLHRQLVSRRILAHVEGLLPGDTLLELQVQSVQRCRDGEFHHLFSGRYRALEPAELETLARLSPEAAAALLHRDVS